MSQNRLRSVSLWLSLLCWAIACSSNSKTEIVPEDDLVQEEPFTLTGRIAIPFAIAGANVELVSLTQVGQQEAGVTLASATTDQDGLFQLEVPPEVESGSVLRVTATGLSAKAMLPGAEVALGADCVLEAVLVWDQAQETNLVVEFWSTLASALVDGVERAQPLARDDVSAWQQRVHQANKAMAEHLTGNSTLDLPWLEPMDPSRSDFSWPSSAASLTLANLALWRLGSGSAEGQQATGVLGLVKLLRQDLSDGLFDGMGYAQEGATKPGALNGLSAQTTRHDLAEALHAALTAPGFPLDVPPALDVVPFGARDGLYALWSLDDGALYPVEPAGVLFDPFLPEVWFSVAPEADGSEACKGFTVEVQAKDNDRIASLVLESPTWEGVSANVETDDQAGTAKATVQLDPLTALALAEASVTIRFRTADPSANEAMVERTLPLHQAAPELEQLNPTDENCLGVWPDTFKVEASDDKGIAKVEVVTDQALYPCTAQGDDVWECERVGEAPVVRATDECGITSEVTIAFCVDGEAPVITYELATPMCGPDYNSALVTVTDNMGVAKVTVTTGGIANDITDFNQPFQVFFDLAGADPAVVTVEARDIWNRTSTLEIQCPLDVVPPLVWPEEGGIVVRPESASVSLEINVADALSDVVEVAVDGDGGSWAVAQSGDMWLITGIKDGGFVNGDLFTLEVVARDYYGNSCLPVSLWVVIDGAAPTLEMGVTSFYDEAGVTPTLDPTGQEAVYDLSAAPTVALTPVTCNPDCPAFTKLPSRLSEAGLSDPVEANLPVFQFVVTEPCLPQGSGDQHVAIKAHFYRDEVLLNTADLGQKGCGTNGFEIPLSIEKFSTQAPEDFEFVEANIPNRLVVETVDQVGNLQTLELGFAMAVPPLSPFISVDVPEEYTTEWVGGSIDPEAPLLHEIAAQGRILNRQRLYNPYPIPLHVKVTGVPQEKVVIQKATIYSNPMEKLGFQCVLNTYCRYWNEEHPAGECLLIVEFPVEDLFRRTNLPTVAFWETPGSSVPMGEEYMELPPFSEAWMTFRNDYATEGFALEAPVPITVDTGVAKPGYLAKSYVASAECRKQDNSASVSYDLPTVLSMYASTTASGTKLYWTAALSGEEVTMDKTTGVGWNYLYWPAFPMHQTPYK